VGDNYYFDKYLICDTAIIVKVLGIRSESVEIQDKLGRYKKEEFIVFVKNIVVDYVRPLLGNP
jgi:GGDEF domain-containing protein